MKRKVPTPENVAVEYATAAISIAGSDIQMAGLIEIAGTNIHVSQPEMKRAFLALSINSDNEAILLESLKIAVEELRAHSANSKLVATLRAVIERVQTTI